MKKIVIRRPGTYTELKIEEFPQPPLAPNEIGVAVDSIGINYADILIRWGVYESAKQLVGWPITPGFEYSGTVEKIGDGVHRFKVGDKVLGVTLFNGYSTYAVSPEDRLFHLPSKMSLEEAAGFPAVFLTAYHALFQNVVIRRGSLLLVHSAAGGVGSALLQLSKVNGFRTIGVVGGSHKIDAAKKFGADFVIDKSIQNLWEEVRRIAPDGVDIVLDANGVSTLSESYKHLRPTGKLLIYGFHSMLPKEGGKLKWGKLAWDYVRTPRYNPLKLCTDNKSIVSFNLSFLFERKDLLDEAMNQLILWIEEGRIIPPQVTHFPFEEVGEAHKSLESGKTVGKLILKV